MNIDPHRHFCFNYKHILIDEIALNGLEGIGFDLLWKYVEKRISSPIAPMMKIKFWSFIANASCISFYQAPDPQPIIEVLDRFLYVDEISGQLLDPADYLDGPYEYHPIKNEYGSCSNYNTRIPLAKDTIASMTYDEVTEQYGDTFVMVASVEERWHAIASHKPFSCLSTLTSVHFCMLELVGRARENGQMTVGKTNLTKISKESKLLFYNRKQLRKLDLIRVQCLTQITQGRGIKSLLLRLKRFHQTRIMSMPKVGKLHDLVEFLRTKPDFSERCDVVMRRGYLSQPDCKKLKKTINVFRFSDKEIREDKANSSTDKKKQDKLQKRKFISLTPSDHESSQSEDENEKEVELESRYNVGVNILRQAYERFLDAGLKGLTQVEVAQLLGVEFYTSRSICRSFKARNIVREFLEDKGRQRTARYIAVAATKEMDSKYAEEKKKLLQYFDNSEATVSNPEENVPEETVPSKKIKLEQSDEQTINAEVMEMDDKVLEVKILDGLQKFNNESLLNSKKSLSLRQLRFANGLLKVINEKQAVSGYQTLCALVSERTGEPPMDTKALKLFVQRLVTDGQLKILKIKWPGFLQKYSILICAPHIKTTSPIIRTKYKDICLKSVVSRKSKIKHSLNENGSRPLSQFAYPRYMKIQKLHELIIQLVYFSPTKQDCYSFPVGVSSLLTIMPEMTIEFALGNISNVGSSDIAHLKVSDDLLKVKLREAPAELYRAIIQSRSMQNSIRSGLKVLAQLGLIQFLSSLNHVQNAKQNVFYVNRNAKVVDTTGEWPRSSTDMKPHEKRFRFNTFDDVKSYWDEVYVISINTDVITDKRERYQANVPTRKESEVEIYDNGEIYGDGMGPCGFHSSVFMDIPRLWHTLYLRNSKLIKSKMKKKRRVVKPIKLDKLKKRKPPASKKVVRKPVEETKSTDKTPKPRHSDVHIKWSSLDDDIIIMCKAAMTIMSPNSQAGCLKIKNTVARSLLTMNDPKKIGRICHRRATILESNPKYSHKKDCILNELRRHRHLIQKYEDLLKKLKIRYCANMTKYVNEGRILMLELVWIISQILKKGIYTQSMPCIAVDYEDFNKKYTITSSSSNKHLSLYKTPVASDPEFATLKEGIILTVMLSYNRDLDPKTATKIYSIFEFYSEETLRSGIEQLRKSGALAAKEKLLNNQMNRIQFNDIVRSSFKISANYRRKWLSRLNSDFVDSLVDNLESEISQTCIKGSPGINCVLFEMHGCDILDIISVTVPAIAGSSGSLMQEEQLNVLDIEMKFKLKSGVAGWKNKSCVKKFCEIYEKCSFVEHLATLLSSAVVDYEEGEVLDLQDPIVSYLNNLLFPHRGSTFRELQENLGYDRQSLRSRLSELEQKKILKRVGYFENRVVLIKYIKPWVFGISNPTKFVIPRPWITLDLGIRHDIFLKWAGVIMNKVFENPGCSILYLSEHTEYLSTGSVLEICMFLENCECVKLNNVELRTVDLFSDDDFVPDITEFNPYEMPDQILVFPVKTSFSRYAYMRKKILASCDTDT